MPRKKKKAEPKEWYWPCNSAEVVADQALKLVPLAAVGLYWLMLNLMHKAPRRGYLEDDLGMPIQPEQLAFLLGRSVDEVSPSLAVLLDRKLFSVSRAGVIFSRRMVREFEEKKELSRARSKAGGKGGSSTAARNKEAKEAQILLEQMLKQKVEQPLKVTLAIDPKLNCSVSEPVQELAEKFAEKRGSAATANEADRASVYLRDLIAAGIAPMEIRTEIERADRPVSEAIWDFCKRFPTGKKGHVRNGQPSREAMKDDILRRLQTKEGNP